MDIESASEQPAPGEGQTNGEHKEEEASEHAVGDGDRSSNVDPEPKSDNFSAGEPDTVEVIMAEPSNGKDVNLEPSEGKGDTEKSLENPKPIEKVTHEITFSISIVFNDYPTTMLSSKKVYERQFSF